MVLINFIYLILSCIIFLSGLYLMKKGLEKYSETKIKYYISKFSASPLRGFAAGTILTTFIQSSSAVTIITIGFVNSGLIKFSDSIGIILGTNIGTTITGHIFTLNILQFNPYLILLGLILIVFKKNKYLGLTLLGFGLVFLGLSFMTLSVEPLKKLNLFQDLLYLNNNNFFIAFISSTFFTGIIQSSSATIAMTIIIAEKGLINIKEAIIIILGANIGTCITAMLAAVNANNAAKKTALAHLILNVYGAVLFFFLINPFTFFITFTSSNISNQIANAHTFYNLICSLTVLPFSKKYAYLIETLYKE